MGKGLVLENQLQGVAGEYFVAAELSLRGVLAAITLRNSRGVDIVASSADGARSVSIQVKTSSDAKPKWILNKKAETFSSRNHFYVFVALTGLGNRPDYYVVPSPVVAEYVTSTHREWLAGKKADGSPRKDSAIRNFSDPTRAYREAWHLLGIFE